MGLYGNLALGGVFADWDKGVYIISIRIIYAVVLFLNSFGGNH